MPIRVAKAMPGSPSVPLPPNLCWLLFRIGEIPEPRLDVLAERAPLDAATLRQDLDALASAGYLTVEADEGSPRLILTTAGRAALERLVAVREQRLATLLDGWSPAQSAELGELIRRLARVLVPDAPRRR